MGTRNEPLAMAARSPALQRHDGRAGIKKPPARYCIWSSKLVICVRSADVRNGLSSRICSRNPSSVAPWTEGRTGRPCPGRIHRAEFGLDEEFEGGGERVMGKQVRIVTVLLRIDPDTSPFVAGLAVAADECTDRAPVLTRAPVCWNRDWPSALERKMQL